MSNQVQVRFIGSDLYCPDCGRWLVRFHDTGTFDLAGKASLSTCVRVYCMETPHGFVPDPDYAPEGIGYEAECLRYLCRIRRWALRKQGRA